MSEIEDCFEKGLLKKADKNKTIALQDIEQGEFFMNEAFDLINLGKKEMASIAMYSAIFHFARSLLYADGIKERSHYCLQKYLEENYEKQGILSSDDLSLFDLLRGMRQEIQYNVSKIKIIENLENLYDKTENFAEKIKKIINSK